MMFDYLKNKFTAVEPRTFASLMELYEDSYIKIRRLIPNTEDIDVGLMSIVHGGVPLLLKVVNRHKFTTTIFLTHRFEDGGETHDDPGLVVNIYHDARMAEVSVDDVIEKFQIELNCRQRTDLKLEKRWELNKFLNKWLRYCLQEGHKFEFVSDIDATVT